MSAVASTVTVLAPPAAFCTAPSNSISSNDASRLEKIYKTYKSKADFYLVYITEAHPQDGRRPSKRVKIERNHAPACATFHDQIDGKELDKKFCLVFERLLIKRM